MSLKLKRVVSGIQPSGILHLGNYLGALKNFVNLQEDKERKCFFFIADHHSATTKFFNEENIESSEIKKENMLDQMVIKTAACILASGINPKKCILFNQSNIPAHLELMWILSCMTPLSWLNKMVQYKEKSKSNGSSAGLYTYPILMAADILMYRGEEVPVGEDQIQHLELAKDLAERLNKICKKEVVGIPKPILNLSSSRIMSLQNGKSKMSKSDKNTHSCLSLITNEEEIKNKIMKAKTDSIGTITYEPSNRPEIANLINIYSHSENISVEDTVKKFESASTLDFKLELIKSLQNSLLPISYKAKNLIEKDFDYVKNVLYEGKKVALEESNKTIAEIKEKMNYFI